MTLTDTYTLANGEKIPVVGFGTWQTPDGDVAEQSVIEAIKAGYRHIDTAAAYKNEVSVGRGIANSGVARDKLYVTTKIWNDIVTYEGAVAAIDESLAKLGLTYVDLFLIHWPNPAPTRETIGYEKRNADVWRALEEAVTVGKIKSIGVSNFRPHHIDALLKTAKIAPVVNQLYVNPSDQQEEVVAYGKAHNILTEAYSPLGTGDVLSVPALVAIAEKHGKSPAQVALKWSLQKGYLPLPKSVTPARIVENGELFDLDLSAEEIATIDGLHGTIRLTSNPDETGF
ncbi:2,5-diketo-D-gluconic acid reductase [Lactococcus hodotermopsidis]|uniref:2,5-diketo-D-gluconic acid reductase n=1 Tax=Pseudolactococcus hodotermopsidis TaxID=2709157 RepID=A0A6A0BFE5_9LACT|nr:aldo/keto reductase [Lactococcus hodotermopsidis]GFH43425.1 2,5-diketo-D-gluconic acid reductase [Lactococcus hodotermopsidis]